jgi:hypothetical protein
MSDQSVAEKEPKTAAPPVAAAPRVVKPLAEMEFGEIGIKQNVWYAIAENNVTPADVLEVGYWAHVVARNLNAFNKICIMNRERTWYGELIVFAIHTQGAIVRWIAPPVTILKAAMPAETSEFEIFDAGMGKEWSVRRMEDGRVMMEGKKSRQEAESDLRSWLRAQGRRAA